MTGLYRPETADLIRGVHEQRAVLTMSDGTTTWDTAPLTGTLTLSEDWSPFGQLTATLANTFTPDDLDKLDPREALGVVLNAGYVHPDGVVDLHPLFTGQLEERKARNSAGVLDIKASTGELFAHEAGWLEADAWKTFTGVTEAIAWLAGYATGAVVVPVSHLGNFHRADLVSAVPLVTGQSLWAPIAEIALAAGVRVYVDTDGTWTIAPKTSLAGVTSAFLSTGGGGIVEDSEDTLTRDGYHGAATLKFQWKDAGGADQTVVGKFGVAGRKTFTETRQFPVSQAQANDAAQAVVRNLSTRGNSYECQGAAAYWLRPGATVQVTLANGVEARHVVRSITFNFTLGTMSVVTREPSNLGV